jgi:hypothetical protein
MNVEKLIGKTITSIYKDEDSNSEIIYVCSDGSIFKLAAWNTDYDGSIDMNLEEITQEEFAQWKNLCHWRIWR